MHHYNLTLISNQINLCKHYAINPPVCGCFYRKLHL